MTKEEWTEMNIYECLIEATERHCTAGAYNAYGYMANSIDLENAKVIASGGKFTTFSGYGGKRAVKGKRTEGVIVFPSEDNEKTLNNLLQYLCSGDEMDYAWKLGRFVKRSVVNPEGYECSDNSLCLAISTFNWGELILVVRNISCWLGFDYVWVKVTNEKRKSCEMCKVDCRSEEFKEMGKLQRGEISEDEFDSFLKEYNSRKPERIRKNIRNEKKWLRILTEDALKRLLKDNYRLGCIVIKEKKHEKDSERKSLSYNDLAERIWRNGYSYVNVFGLARDEICQTCDDPYYTFEADIDQLDRWIIAVPYSTGTCKQKDFEQFRAAITNICSATDEDGCSAEPLICAPNANEDLFQAVHKWIASSEENSGEIYCCIEGPPRSYADGHTKWARGNLNSILQETKTKWPKDFALHIARCDDKM